jgi:histidinol phosphatase-like PHP family hydrolase
MQLRYDWHIHTHHSPCGNREALMKPLVERIRDAGLERWGFADHLFTERNIADLEAARREFDELGPGNGCFAVEASVLRQWDIDRTCEDGNIWGYHAGGPQDTLTLFLPEELLARLGIRYVIAGAHWGLGAEMDAQSLVCNYHRQNMFLAAHPLVTIIAHAWWWRTEFYVPGGAVPFRWLEDFSIIPQSMHDEFAAAVRENGKRVEVNSSVALSSNYSPAWTEQYVDYLALLRESGCLFSTGSDSHAADYARQPPAMGRLLASRGFTEDDFWSGPA